MGLSAGSYCLASCVPVLFPYTGTVRKPSLLSGLSLALLFSTGRLIAYTGLLLAFILLKEFIGVSELVIGIAMLLSGVLLILSALISFGVFRRLSPIDKILCGYITGAKSQLSAIAFMLTLTNVINMGFFMLSFWLASTVVLLMIGGASGGIMAFLGKILGGDRLRRIAAMAMTVIGVVLILQAIGTFSAL